MRKQDNRYIWILLVICILSLIIFSVTLSSIRKVSHARL